MREMNENDKTVCVGIDPGGDGAIAILSSCYEFIGNSRGEIVRNNDGVIEDRSKVIVHPYDPEWYDSWLYHLHNLPEQYPDHVTKVVCVLEHVGAMPGQGVSSTFKFGENFGFIKGLLYSNGVSYELVRPQKWKKEFSCTSDKNTSIEVAKRLFPGLDLRRTDKCKKPHDGICEALLMAEYARRHLA